MKTILLLCGSILLSTVSFGQENSNGEQPEFKNSEKIQTTSQENTTSENVNSEDLYHELGLDPQNTTDAELKQALRDLHYSNPDKYKEINKKYLNYQGRQKAVAIKRADFEALPDEKKQVILNNPERYTVVD